MKVYSVALKALIGMVRSLRIVVVGANDGRVNDPIYDFAMKEARRTEILLVEPNRALLPFLEENYAAHPRSRFAGCAIGPAGTLQLHVVKEDFWASFQPAYAEGWPAYRAATGITSANRAHLERALANEGIDPDDAIAAIDVESKELATLLEEIGWPTPIDVLQVDAEGHDDSVIYSSNLEVTRPQLIYFENRHIPEDRMRALLGHLSERRYKTYRVGGDSLSVALRTSPTCIALHGVVIVARWIGKAGKLMKSLTGARRRARRARA